MNVSGRIEFRRELTYTQSKELEKILLKSSWKISNDGKALEWDGNSVDNMEIYLVKIVEMLKGWKFDPIGIVKVVFPHKEYEMVVLKGKVKIYIDGSLLSISK